MDKFDRNLYTVIGILVTVCLIFLALLSDPWWAAPLGALVGSAIVCVPVFIYGYFRYR